jgi:DNA-binding NarL/FixJ family response regulator
MSLATADINELATHVLAVEDSAADFNLLRLSLSESSQCYQLDCAKRLSDGLSKLGKQRADVVLLDLNLPDSQGRDTIRKIMQHAPHVPVLVLSGSDDDWIALEAVRYGAQDYIVKGQISGIALSRAMRYAIERHNLLMASRREWQKQTKSENKGTTEGPAVTVGGSATSPIANGRRTGLGAFVMKNRQGYEGFVIETRVHERNTGGFSVEVCIEDHDRGGVRESKFYVPNIFETLESAIESATASGRQRIDAGLWN